MPSLARTQAACLKAAMATPLNATSFDAWRVVNGKAYPLVSNATSEEEWRSFSTVCQHKDQVWVREAMANGKTMLHVFVVREKRETYRFNTETKQPERFRPRFLDVVSSVEITEFSPVEPWTWTRGADVVGHVPSQVVDHA